MPRVTLLKAAKDPNRVSIFIDGKYHATVDRLKVRELGIKVDTDLPISVLRELRDQATKEKLTNKALHFLSYRPRSEEELRTHLLHSWRNATDSNRLRRDIDALIAKLRKSELLDDRAFARWWVDARRAGNPRGRRFLAFELQRKGIAKEIVNEILKTEDDSVTARAIAEKQLRKIDSKESPIARRKLSDFLRRRGFAWETIAKIVDELMGTE